MKHHNPHTPIMVREALNTQPRVFARYEFGREKVEELGGEFTILVYGCLKHGLGSRKHERRLWLWGRSWSREFEEGGKNESTEERGRKEHVY
jgi:hypothetical protein